MHRSDSEDDGLRARSTSTPPGAFTVSYPKHGRHATPICALSFPGWVFLVIYAVFGNILFWGVIILAVLFHYEDVVRNALYHYPDEWWPSVSASLGDFLLNHWFSNYFLAIASGPRLITNFTMAYYSYSMIKKYFHGPQKRWLHVANFTVFVLALVRFYLICTFVIITSREWHSRHDWSSKEHIGLTVFYFPLCTWMMDRISKARIANGRSEEKWKGLNATQWRWIHIAGWMLNTVCVAFWFYQHAVREVAGAYSVFSLHEFVVVISDIAFDLIHILDLKNVQMSCVIS